MIVPAGARIQRITDPTIGRTRTGLTGAHKQGTLHADATVTCPSRGSTRVTDKSKPDTQPADAAAPEESPGVSKPWRDEAPDPKRTATIAKLAKSLAKQTVADDQDKAYEGLVVDLTVAARALAGR